MVTFTAYTLLQASFSAFLILFFNVTGSRNYLVSRSKAIISKIFDCDFCLSFWINLIVSIGQIVFNELDILYFLMAVAATPITKKLL